ncbi:iron-sulfur cluster assembly scaffold protein [Sinimarinibacterium thermocellulolyticum]|uniref:Iron-sulfur cluster assembly scaffold protein n=1 Tax=Sinimarinibacterium thermocellulolyticum TaxID=3170016 RepID=A0ABV2ABW5_9GAMM
MDNVFAYPDPVWRRFVAPARSGRLNTADALCVQARTPAAAAVLELSLRAGPPAQARFRAFGCPVTIAVGAWLAEVLETEGVAALQRIDAAHILSTLEIPQDRAHCALLGEDVVLALRKALNPAV